MKIDKNKIKEDIKNNIKYAFKARYIEYEADPVIETNIMKNILYAAIASVLLIFSVILFWSASNLILFSMFALAIIFFVFKYLYENKLYLEGRIHKIEGIIIDVTKSPFGFGKAKNIYFQDCEDNVYEYMVSDKVKKYKISNKIEFYYIDNLNYYEKDDCRSVNSPYLIRVSKKINLKR